MAKTIINGGTITNDRDETGVTDTDELSGIEIIRPDDDLQARFDEHGTKPVTFVIPEGDFTAPTYGFQIYDNTKIRADPHKTTIRANAPDGSLTGADKYAIQNTNNHQAPTPDGNDNIYLQGLSLKGNLRLTADAPTYRMRNITVRDVSISEVDAFSMYLRGIDNLTVDNVICNNSAAGAEAGGNDGVHLMDCQRFRVSDVSGYTGDDLVSIEANAGNIRAGSVSGVHGRTEISALVKVYLGPETSTGQTIEDVSIRDVSATAPQTALVWFAANSNAAGAIHDVAVSDVSGLEAENIVAMSSASGITQQNIQFDNVGARTMTGRGFILYGDDISLRHPWVRNYGGTASPAVVDCQATDATITDPQFEGFAGHGIGALAAGVEIRGGRIDCTGGLQAVNVQAPDVHVSGLRAINGSVSNPNDEVGAIENDYAQESANAEVPQYDWPIGTIVEFTDSGDGSGTGTYLTAKGGTWIQLA